MNCWKVKKLCDSRDPRFNGLGLVIEILDIFTLELLIGEGEILLTGLWMRMGVGMIRLRV